MSRKCPATGVLLNDRNIPDLPEIARRAQAAGRDPVKAIRLAQERWLCRKLPDRPQDLPHGIGDGFEGTCLDVPSPADVGDPPGRRPATAIDQDATPKRRAL